MKNDLVGWDCRPGDVICLQGTGNVRVVCTYPQSVLVEAKDGRKLALGYRFLYAERAYYVAKCEPVRGGGG